ncbi:RNA-directed DNA polymerase, partial [Limosilactobacillus reuteri]
KCISLPVESTGKNNDREETILNWWENLEQATIRFSLNYQYCIKTDITNCYGSIYTHSIAWAIDGKKEAKKKDSKDFGAKLDKRVREVQYGQTNGILQGGQVYNLIAEIVMGYADMILSEQLNSILSSKE